MCLKTNAENTNITEEKYEGGKNPSKKITNNIYMAKKNIRCVFPAGFWGGDF